MIVADRGNGFNSKGVPGKFINFNVGSNIESVLPKAFWNNVANKLGSLSYVDKNGEDVAVINAVESVTYCLQEKNCVDLPFST